MQLKQYQTDTLGVLRRFFEDARLRGPKAAYEAITQEPEQAKRLRGYGGKYEALLGQEEMPYVCLRLPTGGGKTLLGAHAIGVAWGYHDPRSLSDCGAHAMIERFDELPATVDRLLCAVAAEPSGPIA